MELTTLDQLANKYKTDKGTLFDGACRHGYAPFYDEILTDIRNDPIKLLEIGVWLELSTSTGGESIYMWRDYFKDAEIYTFDIRDMTNHPAIANFSKTFFYQGDQGNRQNLKEMHNHFGNPVFDFILEDGSHKADHQAISLAQLFSCVKPRGIYFLEDITIPGHRNCNGMNNDDTYNTLNHFINTKQFNSPYITLEEKLYLEENIDKIILHTDVQNAWMTAAIYKK